MWIKNGIGILQMDAHLEVDAHCLSYQIISNIIHKKGIGVHNVSQLQRL